MLGKHKTDLPPTGTFLWTDVRDLALAHIRAAELPDAAGKRFFIVAGYFSNRGIADAIREGCPELADRVPGEEVKGDLDEEGSWAVIARAGRE